MQVFLRISPGVLTRKIQIPDHCLHTTFKLPIIDKPEFSKTKFDAFNTRNLNKYMEFEWDLKSTGGPTNIPIMDLKRIEA